MQRLRTVIAAAIGLGLCAGSTSQSDPSAKISPFLAKEMTRDGQVSSAIIYFHGSVPEIAADAAATREERAQMLYEQLTSAAERAQAGVRALLEQQGLRYKSFYINNSIVIEQASAAQIMKLASRDDVRRMTSNQTFQALPTVFDGPLVDVEIPAGPGSNITSTGAVKVWDDFQVRGEGIVVAGQDTGIQWDHPGLKRQYRGWNGSEADHNYNWYDAVEEPFPGAGGNNKCGYASAVPCDDHGHGTHTVGTIVGDDGAGNQVGMAPAAKWIGCRNMDAGLGRPSSYISCFQFFFAPFPYGGDPAKEGDPTRAPHVINNSWGCPPDEGCQEAEILPILKVLKDAGILVVASAGNDGSSCGTVSNAPAMHSAETLSVGAHDSNSGNIASFSSRGPSTYDKEVGPDVTAPGVNVRSTIPGNGYSGTFWSGTSMAGPHVVGQVALLWAADPTLVGDFESTVQVIRSTATPVTSTQACGGVQGSAVPNNTYGYGRIDAYKAVASRRSSL